MNWAKNFKISMALIVLCMLCTTSLLNADFIRANDPDITSQAYQEGRYDEAHNIAYNHSYVLQRKKDAYKRGRDDMREDMKKNPELAAKLSVFKSRLRNPYEYREKTVSYSDLYAHGPMYADTNIPNK